MRRPSRLTPAQQAAYCGDARRDKAFMSNAERRAVGLMDRQQAAAHERLAILPHARLAERSRKPLADDPWATGGGPDAA